MASLSVKKEGRKEGKKGGRKEFVEGRVLYSDPLKVLEMKVHVVPLHFLLSSLCPSELSEQIKTCASRMWAGVPGLVYHSSYIVNPTPVSGSKYFIAGTVH